MQEKMGHRTETQEERQSSPLLCVSLVCSILSCTHYFQAPAVQGIIESK